MGEVLRQRGGIESRDGAALFARALYGFRHQIRRIAVKARRVERVIVSVAFQTGTEFRRQQRQTRYRAVRLRHAPSGQKRHGDTVQTGRHSRDAAKERSRTAVIGEHAPAQPQRRAHTEQEQKRT